MVQPLLKFCSLQEREILRFDNGYIIESQSENLNIIGNGNMATRKVTRFGAQSPK